MTTEPELAKPRHDNENESKQKSNEQQLEDSQQGTQATDGYDASQQLIDELAHEPTSPAVSPEKPNAQPRLFHMPDSPEPDESFTFGKASTKPPVIARPPSSKTRSLAGAVDANPKEYGEHATAAVAASKDGPSNQHPSSNEPLHPNHEGAGQHGGDDAPVPEHQARSTKDGAIRDEEVSTLLRRATKMKEGPMQRSLPGSVTPPANAIQRPTQAKAKPAKNIAASLPFQDVQSPGVRTHSPEQARKNSQVLTATPLAPSYLPSPLSVLQNTTRQPFSLDQDATEGAETPLPVARQKHSEPQQLDAATESMDDKTIEPPTEDGSSHLEYTDETSPTLSSDRPEVKERVDLQKLNALRLHDQQLPHVKPKSLASQGSKARISSSKPSETKPSAPSISAEDPFPDISNADNSPSAGMTYAGVSKLSNRDLAQRQKSLNELRYSPSARVAKVKKSASHLQALRGKSASSARNTPERRLVVEGEKKQKMHAAGHSLHRMASASNVAEMQQDIEISQDNESSSGSNRVHRHEGSRKARVTPLSDLLTTSDSVMERARQLILQEKKELERKLQQETLRNVNLSNRNSKHEERINELNELNGALRQRFAKLDSRAQEFSSRMEALFDDQQAVGKYIKQNKGDTKDCKRLAQEMKALNEEASEQLTKVGSHQKKFKVIVGDAIKELEDQKEKVELNRHLIGKTVHNLQEERDKNAKLRKELDEAFSSGFKAALDEHRTEVFTKFSAYEAELKNAIKNAEGGTEQTLISFLGNLEPMTKTIQDSIKKTTREAIDESVPKVPNEITDILEMLKTLSKSIEGRLHHANDESDNLRKAGAEILDTLKEKVEAMSTAQDAQITLNDRIASLQATNSRLEKTAEEYSDSVSELQKQLDARQEELAECQEQLQFKDNELQQVRERMHNDSTVLEEVKQLRSANAKIDGDYADVMEKLGNAQATLQGETKKACWLQEQNSILEQKLKSVEAKVSCSEEQLQQQRENVAEELEKQRIAMEEDKRSSLKQEQQSHVQKISGQKNKLMKLQSDYDKVKSIADDRYTQISKLQAEIGSLRKAGSEKTERIVHLENQSSSNHAEHESALEALRLRNLEISQIKDSLTECQEGLRSKSQRVNDIEKCVGELAITSQGLQARLLKYEEIEKSIRESSRQHQIPIGNDTIEEFIEKLTSLKQPAAAAEYQSRSTSIGHDSEKHSENIMVDHPSIIEDSDARKSQSSSGYPKEKAEAAGSNETHPGQGNKVQVPVSPEVVDAQASSAPSPSPIPTMRQTRRVAPGRKNSMQPPPKGFKKNTTEYEITTKFRRVRESRTVQGSQGDRRRLSEQSTPRRRAAAKGNQSVPGDNTESPMTDVSPVVDFIDDHPGEDHSQLLTRQRSNKWSNGDEPSQSTQKTATPSMGRSKSQGMKPPKGILKKSAPMKEDATQPDVHASQNPVSVSAAPQKQHAKLVNPRCGLVSVSGAPSTGKDLPSNGNASQGNNEEVGKPYHPKWPSPNDDIDHIFKTGSPRQSQQKRAASSISGGASREPSAKRMSFPYNSSKGGRK